MDLTNSFELPLGPGSAWNTLLDIKRIMPCIPGAELLEASEDGSTYKGKVSVKLGPVALAFVGTAAFVERDEGGRRARLKAKGNDSKGRGGVQAEMTFQVVEAAAGSRITVLTQVTLTGAVAQYGRGTGIIQGVASQLIAQFGANLKASLAATDRSSVQPAPPAQTGVKAAGDVSGSDRPSVPIAVGEQAAAARATASRAPAPPAPAVKPISGFSLLLKVLWSRLIGLFGRRA